RARWLAAVPPADVGGQRLGVARSPRAAIVLGERRGLTQDRLDDRPRRLAAVLAREEQAVTLHRVAEETLVGVHLVALGLVDDFQLGRVGGDLLAGPLDAGADADHDLRAQAEPEVVRIAGGDMAERRALQRHRYLRGRHRQALAGADDERHALPAP